MRAERALGDACRFADEGVAVALEHEEGYFSLALGQAELATSERHLLERDGSRVFPRGAVGRFLRVFLGRLRLEALDHFAVL